jgi:trehalose utilization protein
MSADAKLNVLVWDENPPHAPKEVYPESIRGAIVEGLHTLDVDGLVQARGASLDDPDQGITPEILAETDVLLWWGHARHGEVNDTVAAQVAEAVRERGMGFVALHSAHYSKTFKAVLQATGHLKGGWRETNPPDSEEITVCAPRHPIAQGVADFTLTQEEMYGAPFDVPPAEVLVFQSYFPLGNEYFPAGICWSVGEGIDPEFTSGPGGGQGQGEGKGRVFYFRPGHEAFPTYFDLNVRRVIYNATLWAGRKI